MARAVGPVRPPMNNLLAKLRPRQPADLDVEDEAGSPHPSAAATMNDEVGSSVGVWADALLEPTSEGPVAWSPAHTVSEGGSPLPPLGTMDEGVKNNAEDPTLSLMHWLTSVTCCATPAEEGAGDLASAPRESRAMAAMAGRERPASGTPARMAPPRQPASLACIEAADPCLLADGFSPAPNEDSDPWEERRQRTGACARLVRYQPGDQPRRDVSFSGGDGKRIQVTWMRAQGRTHLAGVKLGDTLASIDGWRVPKEEDAESVYNRVNAPCILIFLGFIGKMNAEVRLTTQLPKLGLSLREDLFKDVSPLAVALSLANADHLPSASPSSVPPALPSAAPGAPVVMAHGRIEEEVDFTRSNESLFFLVDDAESGDHSQGSVEVSRVTLGGGDIGDIGGSSGGTVMAAGCPSGSGGSGGGEGAAGLALATAAPGEMPGNSGFFFSAVAACADDEEEDSTGLLLPDTCYSNYSGVCGTFKTSVPSGMVLEVKAREARALVGSIMQKKCLDTLQLARGLDVKAVADSIVPHLLLMPLSDHGVASPDLSPRQPPIDAFSPGGGFSPQRGGEDGGRVWG